MRYEGHGVIAALIPGIRPSASTSRLMPSLLVDHYPRKLTLSTILVKNIGLFHSPLRDTRRMRRGAVSKGCWFYRRDLQRTCKENARVTLDAELPRRIRCGYYLLIQ